MRNYLNPGIATYYSSTFKPQLVLNSAQMRIRHTKQDRCEQPEFTARQTGDTIASNLVGLTAPVWLFPDALKPQK